MEKNQLRGFTLVELMIAICVITLLLLMGIVSFPYVLKKARDAKRKTDLRYIQNAFEQYYSACGNKYPVITPSAALTGSLTCATVTDTFITYPNDPLGSGYQCVSECSTSKYTVCPPVIGSQYLETESNCIPVTPPATPVCCVKNQQ